MNVLGILAFAAISIAAAFLLWMIVRFSIVSPWISRGSRASLRHPDLAATEKLIGYPLPSDAEEFYRAAPFVESFEFVLIGPTGERWEIAEFYPLTSRDVMENQKIHGVKEIPLAADSDKGVYVLLQSGAVAHWPPGRRHQPIMVCGSLTEWARFAVGNT